jgi:hypothetical protein
MTGACPQCGGVIQVVNTVIVGESRVRYYGCRQCGFRPEANKQTVPLCYAPRRLATGSKTHAIATAQLG